jgi:hypothetical protein
MASAYLDHSVLRKGSRIRANWLDASLVALAGVQMKFGAKSREVVGVIRHMRGDHPTNPTEIRYYIDPDDGYVGPKKDLIGCTCGHPHVEIKPEWVSEIL